jgi:predicted GNAT family N-acyltransferase
MKTVRIAEVTTPADIDRALDIRREVFCREQGVPEGEEMDGLDDACRHYLARLDDEPVGTARTRILAGGEAKIERVAVRAPFRALGIGHVLVKRLIADLGPSPIALNAQLRTVGFYQRLGFKAEGEIFLDAGIDHVRMTLAVPA